MIDLHCHSIFSDGTSSPEELLELARQAGVTALALTDHDTTDGLARFLSASSAAGIELSAEAGETPLHLLGYFFDPADVALQSTLDWVRAGRTERNVQILEKLNRLGYAVTHDDLTRQAGDRLVGRPHFAAALIEKGYFKHREKIFRQLLGKGKAAYADRRRLSPTQCIAAIRRAGGVAVLAHPGQMKLSSRPLRRLVKQLKEQGLGGVEVWHPTHAPHQSTAFLRLCADFDLAASGGSDFHGKLTPDLQIGRGFGELCVPEEALERLRARAGNAA
jgi:predicted metal-dependent phosphoesterase TrpH